MLLGTMEIQSIPPLHERLPLNVGERPEDYLQRFQEARRAEIQRLRPDLLPPEPPSIHN